MTKNDPLDRMTYKRIYFLLVVVCIIGALGLYFGDGDLLIYMGSSVGVISGVLSLPCLSSHRLYFYSSFLTSFLLGE
jgi:hypothetical protein